MLKQRSCQCSRPPISILDYFFLLNCYLSKIPFYRFNFTCAAASPNLHRVTLSCIVVILGSLGVQALLSGITGYGIQLIAGHQAQSAGCWGHRFVSTGGTQHLKQLLFGIKLWVWSFCFDPFFLTIQEKYLLDSVVGLKNVCLFCFALFCFIKAMI